LLGCIRAKKRSSPYASISDVDSKFAGDVAIPAEATYCYKPRATGQVWTSLAA